MLDGIERWQGMHAALLRKPICWQDGYVIPPVEPGLGIELDERVARSHPYTGEALHLEMAAEPVA